MQSSLHTRTERTFGSEVEKTSFPGRKGQDARMGQQDFVDIRCLGNRIALFQHGVVTYIGLNSEQECSRPLSSCQADRDRRKLTGLAGLPMPYLRSGQSVFCVTLMRELGGPPYKQVPPLPHPELIEEVPFQ